jgi:hypothetical protein
MIKQNNPDYGSTPVNGYSRKSFRQSHKPYASNPVQDCLFPFHENSPEHQAYLTVSWYLPTQDDFF